MSNDERAKLRTLLNYWIAHNKEHAQQFKEWAGRARGLGEAEVSRELVQAVQEMDRASEILSQALRRLEGKEL